MVQRRFELDRQDLDEKLVANWHVRKNEEEKIIGRKSDFYFFSLSVCVRACVRARARASVSI